MPETDLTSLYVMAAIYIVAGIFHFITPKIFLKVMPNWVPKPKVVNILVGIIEIGLNSTNEFAEFFSIFQFSFLSTLYKGMNIIE